MKSFFKNADRSLTKVLLISFCLIFTSINLCGQNGKGLKINIGTSIIEDEPELGADLYTEKFAPSVNLGYFLKFPINKKFILRTSLDFNLIQSKETRRLSYTYSRYINYLSIPVLIETNSSRFNVGLGIQNSFKLFGGGKTNYTETINGNEKTTTTKFKSTEYEFYDFGAILNLSCFISKQIRIECQYYHGLSNIHSEESVRKSVISWKARQILLGVSVSINN